MNKIIHAETQFKKLDNVSFIKIPDKEVTGKNRINETF
jgi:hypothetical protein